eukprot:CAMPEP_0194165758 /NCGR_PEP_ID=MMETSP0154-20130528/1585_1 /TAXON_ID=1049557 /ORGANISM="Thalassiothrix antarctica, Strain L6-D1" /LENGTH=515 /DNA_ID=CAMNT_0038876277 /DNA_START=127 /DNA_END=1674 /DNA_ORIENTATION=-
MPNNLHGWKGGHNCNLIAPKCQVKTQFHIPCGGQIRRCSDCDFSFCHAHRQPGYTKGHACLIGCDTTFHVNCVGKRSDLTPCKLCDSKGNKYKYCIYHLLPVATLVAIGDKDGGGGHVCQGFTSGSVFFGDKASDFAGILLDATILVVKGDASRLTKRFAANSVAVLVGEMQSSFGIGPEELRSAITGAAGILHKVKTDLVQLNTKMLAFEDKVTAPMEVEAIKTALKGPLTDVVTVCKAVKNMAGTASTSLRELMKESAEAQVKIMYDSMNAYVTKLAGNADLVPIKVLLVKIDKAIKNLDNPMVNMVPDQETINRLLQEMASLESEAEKKAEKVAGAVETVVFKKFKILVKYLDQFFDFIAKVVTVVEILTKIEELVKQVSNIDSSTPEEQIQALFEQGVSMTKTMFTLTGYYDTPNDVSDECWDLEKFKDTDDKKDARLLSVELVSPSNGSRLDARKEEQVMNDMRERRYQMVRLEKTVEGMQHEIERLKAEAREQREHGTPLTTDNDETWT